MRGDAKGVHGGRGEPMTRKPLATEVNGNMMLTKLEWSGADSKDHPDLHLYLSALFLR
jgi:hypothetical protein